MFINDALAQTVAAEAPQISMATSTFVQVALIVIVFYFFLIRPQQKKIKQHQMMLDAIQKGDHIITGGGIYGTVTKVDGDKLDVKIADGFTVTVNRMTVRDIIDEKVETVRPTTPKAKKSSKAVEKK